jgi:hypothetical protein
VSLKHDACRGLTIIGPIPFIIIIIIPSVYLMQKIDYKKFHWGKKKMGHEKYEFAT